MTSVITGDVVHSSRVHPSSWMKKLKKELEVLGKSPQVWEIYRGDSFQVEISNPFDALEMAIKIKAAIKTIKGIDVRMAIGIGDKTFSVAKITQCNGSAFMHSGRMYEWIEKNKINLGIQSPWPDFDKVMNLYSRLALIAMDNWTVNGAAIVLLSLHNRNKSQEELGQMLGIKQNTVSMRLKRAYYSEILDFIEMYKEKLSEKI